MFKNVKKISQFNYMENSLRNQMLQKLKEDMEGSSNSDTSDEELHQSLEKIDNIETNKTNRKRKINSKLTQFNQCLKKLKRENPQLSHRQAQTVMKSILKEIKETHDNPEQVFMTMEK